MKDLYMSSYSQVKFLPFVRSSELNLRTGGTDNKKVFLNSYNTIKYFNKQLRVSNVINFNRPVMI